MPNSSSDGEPLDRTLSLVAANPTDAAQHETKSLHDTSGTAAESTEIRVTEVPFPRIPGYEVLALLGRGGMGAVYQARDLKLKRIVALKLILAGAQASPSDIARFRLEGEAVAKLQHPNIVQIYEIGEHSGQHYFALEFVPGQTLAQHLAGTPLQDGEAVQLVETLARAMHVAHSQGIIHRDLKPGNVLLTKQLLPKITDFGLAKQLDQDSTQTASGVILGTPSYMAPEQAFGDNRQVGPLSDVYALGAILYECLTGRPPFRASTLVETVLLVRTEEPVPPLTMRPRLPRDLNTICLKALHKDPARRYASALDLAEDLARFSRQEPILARSSSAWERAWRWCRRKPLVASLLATVAIAVLTVSVTLAFAYSRVSRALLVATEERAKTDRAFIRERDARQAAVIAAQRESVAKQKAVVASEEAIRAKQATDVALEASDLSLARSRLLLAQQHWLNNDIPEAEQLLDRCPLAFRHWEWHYLKRLCHSEVKIIDDDRAFCNAAYSADGRYLVTGDATSGLRLWDPEKLEVVKTISTGGAPPQALAISPRGDQVAALLPNGLLCVWDAATGEPVASILGIQATFRNHVSFSPDGKRLVGPQGQVCDLATSSIVFQPDGKTLDHTYLPDGQLITSNGKELRIWDSTGKEVRTLPISETSPIEMSSDGRWLGIGLIDGVEVYDVQTGGRKFSFRAQSDTVADICFSTDGKRLAAACGDRAVRVWDIENTRLMSTFRGHSAVPRWVSFDRSGKRLASAAPNEVRIWDAGNDPEITRWQTGGSLVVVDPLRPRFVTCGMGVNELTVRACDTGDPIQRRPEAGEVLCAAYSRDGSQLAIGGPRGITIWDGETVELRHELPPMPAAVIRIAFSNDGKILFAAAADKKIYRWNLDPLSNVASAQLPSEIYRVVPLPGGAEVALLVAGKIVVWDSANPTQARILPPERVLDFALSPDGSRIATTHSYETGVQLWDRHTLVRVANLSGKYGMGRVAFHPEGDRIVACTYAGAPVSQVIVWDCDTGQELLVFRERGLVRLLTEVAFSSNGDYMFAQGGTYTRRWNARPEPPETLALSGHGGWVSGVAYTSNGQSLLSSSSDGHVRLWGLRRSHLKTDLRAGGIRVLESKFLAKDREAITVSDRVRRWNLERGELLLEYPTGNASIDRIAVSHDEKRLAMVSPEPVVQLFDIAEGTLLQEWKLHEKPVAGVAFSPDDQWLVTVGGDAKGGEVVIWNTLTGTGKLVTQPGLVREAAFHPSENSFATVSQDGRVLQWNIAGEIERTLYEKIGEQLHAVAWSLDGRFLASGGSARVARLWNVDTGEMFAEWRQPQTVNDLTFSPASDELAIALQGDLVRVVKFATQPR